MLKIRNLFILFTYIYLDIPGDLPPADPEVARKNERLLRPHELYTAEIGGYLCWIVSRGIAVVVTLLPQGRAAILNKLKHWARVALQYALPVLTLLGIFVLVPLLFGLLLEQVVVIPLRVPIRNTPIHFCGRTGHWVCSIPKLPLL